MLTDNLNQKPQQRQQKQPQQEQTLDVNVLCRECGRDVYRSLSHKRFYKLSATFVSPIDCQNNIDFSDWLKQYQWSDIEYISFGADFIDVVYMDEVISQHKETNNATEPSQISLV
jgi:hypothetical protein